MLFQHKPSRGWPGNKVKLYKLEISFTSIRLSKKLLMRTKFSDAIKCCMNAAIDTFHQYKTRCVLKMIDVVNA